ncbi:MAG TPA: ankyrin repeat domain-containing protein, partial [Leptospiraceae bacterium]|nr:ankyrin repeat domain-containing protein [Leptospiraceae bacterium]
MKYTRLILLLGFFSGACLTPDYNRSSYRENAADVVYRGDLFALQNSIQRGASINERDSFQRKYTPLMVAA